ncbi:MAG: hypothetical protein KDA50_12620 [Rhodobacteraceae bacterium]|nr:hypothetical protein [Paracoccaceae bacterium]
MILTLLHFLGFSTAIGGGAAVLVLMARIAAAPDTAPHLRPAIKTIAGAGLVAIAVLWVTGLAMWVGRHGAAMDLGGGWHLKLTAAAGLTLLAGFAYARMAMGRPLPLPVARAVLLAQLALAVTAMAAALATFGA